jgi:hypothetical protein
VDDSEAVGAVNDGLELAVILAQGDDPAVTGESPGHRGDFDRQERRAELAFGTASGEAARLSTGDESGELLGSKGATAGDERDGLEDGGLALGISAGKDIESWAEFDLDVFQDPKVFDAKMPEPGHGSAQNLMGMTT